MIEGAPVSWSLQGKADQELTARDSDSYKKKSKSPSLDKLFREVTIDVQREEE